MVLKSNIITAYLLLVVIVSTPAKTYCQQSDTAKVKVSFAGYPFPKPMGWVNDFEHMFSRKQIDTLTNIIVANERLTTNQISIVTIKDTIINADNIKDYGTALFNAWGVGVKGKNNGVLICLVPGKHLIRISNGYGIDGKMTDEETKQIIDNIITPEFKKGDYYAGIKNGVLAIIDKIK